MRWFTLGIVLFLGCGSAPSGPAQPAVLKADEEKMINDQIQQSSNAEANQPQEPAQ